MTGKYEKLRKITKNTEIRGPKLGGPKTPKKRGGVSGKVSNARKVKILQKRPQNPSQVKFLPKFIFLRICRVQSLRGDPPPAGNFKFYRFNFEFSRINLHYFRELNLFFGELIFDDFELFDLRGIMRFFNKFRDFKTFP